MKILLILLSLMVLVAGGMMMLNLSSESEWTTDSEDALRKFELGLEARMKYYTGEARDHFQAAVDIDSDFAAAKLYLSSEEFTPDWEQRKRLQEELRAVDLESLNPRERFLLEFRFAEWDRDIEKAKEIALAYLAEYPGDPFGLATLADLVWSRQNWEESERLYRQLLKVDPNWVTAQNRLGYIALARGSFEEAAEQFDTYFYIAPDQANPYDSRGEMLVLLGRYDEAREVFEKAIDIRPSFCNAYQHLIEVVMLQDDLEDGEEILRRAAEHCPERMVESLRCSVLIWHDFINDDAERVWSDEREECRRKMGEYHFVLHRTACKTGRLKIAERAERGLRRRIEAAEEARHVRLDFIRALLLHMEGTRLMTLEHFDQAADKFAEADESLLYWGEGQGILKLYNRLNLAYALEELGLEERSEGILEEVRAVNEPFAASYPESVRIR